MTRRVFQRAYRIKMRNESNNEQNPNKNVCALAVARLLCCDQQTRYLHNWGDLQRAIRSLWSMRSVKTYVKATPDSTVGSLRKAMHEYATNEQHLIAYVIRVEGHVLMIDRNGKTLVDTAPRKRDRRKVLDITGIYLPDSSEKLEALSRASAARVEEQMT
jgi:hypothetical protein